MNTDIIKVYLAYIEGEESDHVVVRGAFPSDFDFSKIKPLSNETRHNIVSVFLGIDMGAARNGFGIPHEGAEKP